MPAAEQCGRQTRNAAADHDDVDLGVEFALGRSRCRRFASDGSHAVPSPDLILGRLLPSRLAILNFQILSNLKMPTKTVRWLCQDRRNVINCKFRYGLEESPRAGYSIVHLSMP